MEEIGGETSLSITDMKSRPGVPAASYEATYEGLRVFVNESPKGVKKVVSLSFKITSGPERGRYVFFKGQMYQNDGGDWVIGSKSRLAEAIRAITGKDTIDASNKGTNVIVGVAHTKGKKPNPDGTPRIFIEVDTIVARPGGLNPAAPERTQQSAPVAAAVGVSAPVTQERKPVEAAPKGNKDLLDSLTELGDFSL